MELGDSLRKKGISESSIKTYLQSIKKINKELFNSKKICLQYFRDHDSVIEYLDSIPNLSTRKTITVAIIVVLKHSEIPGLPREIYSQYHKKLANLQSDSYLDNEKTDKEKKNWITGKEIDTVINTLFSLISNSEGKLEPTIPKSFKGTPRQFLDKVQQHLVVSLHKKLPLRNDFALVKVISGETIIADLDKSFNYINTDTSKLFLCNYKTFTAYGVKNIEVPESLIFLIKNFQEIKKNILEKNDNGFLLVNSTNSEPMKKNSLTKYINKIFGKNISTSLLRKVYLSEKYPVINNFREREKDSYMMCHSTSMAQTVYSKK